MSELEMGTMIIRGARVVTPGKDLGVTDVVVERGEIVPGQIADLVLVDAELNPVATIVEGRVQNVQEGRSL